MTLETKTDANRARKRIGLVLLGALVLAGGTAPALLAQAKSAVDPYWLSLRDDKAYMRTGPRDSYPIKWVYVRKYLPVKVVGKEADWRMVEDPDGVQGWMHLKLLSTQRTAYVTGDGPAPLRDAADANARVNWRVEPGVVGKISDCSPTWCLFDVSGRLGYIDREAIWGDEDLPGEKNK